MVDLGLSGSGVGTDRMGDGVNTDRERLWLRERLNGVDERELLWERFTGDALDVDREEDLEQLRGQFDGDGDQDICEDALDSDLDGGGEFLDGGDAWAESAGEGARDALEAGEASRGASVGEYAGDDGGGGGEDSMLDTSLSL